MKGRLKESKEVRRAPPWKDLEDAASGEKPETEQGALGTALM